MFELKGRSALVTGASGGIGSAIAKLLIERGATVSISGRNEAALNKLALDLGKQAHVLVADLKDKGSTEDLIHAAHSEMGGLDILVNNAGLTRDGLAIRMKAEDWKAVLEVNLTAGFRLAQSAVKIMLKARYGRIINVTSIVAQTGNPGQVNYVASKAGMTGLTKSLAAEVASRNITVNCVAPGFIETPMTEALSDSQRKNMLERIPVSRFGEPEDVAACVLFLASIESGYLTGQTLHVNGGMAMI
ncbi:MAG: 3-oxoacyl-[acyl-carrier-protein] reductase [Rhodospirillales bacterium]|nr:3-oxoacyl-[acyl-carrier-protein] reductase [Rhodospirillales bacterium]